VCPRLPGAAGGGAARPRLGRVEEEPHPITDGLAEFDVQDELFLVEGDARQWYVLARVEGHPVAFLKHWFLGRVFNCTLGHDSLALTNAAVQTLYIRGIRWAAHKL
jgi:type 1 glutamine amidotransferase